MYIAYGNEFVRVNRKVRKILSFILHIFTGVANLDIC